MQEYDKVLIIGENKELRSTIEAITRYESGFNHICILPVLQDLQWDNIEKKILSCLKQNHPQHIVHLGLPRSALKKKKEQERQEYYKEHVHQLKKMLDILVRQNFPGSCLYCSSGEIYGERINDIPVCEENNIRLHAAHERCLWESECLFQNSAMQGMKSLIVRLFDSTYPRVSGTRHPLEDYCSQMKTIQQGMRPPEMWVGDLNEYHDFLSIQDIARALLNVLKVPQSGEIFNISSGEGIHMFDLVSEMIVLSGLDIKIHLDSLRGIEKKERIAIGCNEKIKKTGWRPKERFLHSLYSSIAYSEERI